MQVYTACRIEMMDNPIRGIEQHPCLIRNVAKTTMVVKLHYSEWNTNAIPSTSVDGILVRCYFNPKDKDSNYIIAYGDTKAQSKRALLQFLHRYPLQDKEQSVQSTPNFQLA